MTPRAGLTQRQAETLKFIKAFIKTQGYSPSYAEIAEGIGVSARSSIHRLVRELKERGAITFIEHGKRSIYVREVA